MADVYGDSVTLLLPFDAANGSTVWTDLSPLNPKTSFTKFGAPVISTAQSKFGGSALSLSGSSSLRVEDHADWDMSGDFTMEAWVYWSSTPPAKSSIFTLRSSGVGLARDANGKLISYNFSSQELTGATTITNNAWHHVALVRIGANYAMFLDGILQGATTNYVTPASLTPTGVYIGSYSSTTDFMVGYIDEVRITKGFARYTANFLPPTSSFTGTANTRSLIGNIITTNEPASAMQATHYRAIIGNITTANEPASAMQKSVVGQHSIIGNIITTNEPASAMQATHYRAIIGNITTTNEPVSAMLKKVIVTRSVVSNIRTTNAPASAMAKIAGRGIIGLIVTRNTPVSSMSKPVIVPANWVSRRYQCKITGTTDLVFPISSFNANLAASGGSFLSLVIHGNGELFGEIIARKSGEIIVTRLHIYSDGSTVSREFIRVSYDTIGSAEGPKAGTTITLQGRKKIAVRSSKTVRLTDATYRSFSGGLVRYRCAVNDELSLGDTAIINGEQLIVGSINYSVSVKHEFMEILEYRSNGTDLGAAIGSNSRLPTLTEYSVTTANPNYTLWMSTAFFYNSITTYGQTAGQPFTLYYDSSGLLWFLAGFEGSSNVAVYRADGITQASINV